jgi:hypothetical protein
MQMDLWTSIKQGWLLEIILKSMIYIMKKLITQLLIW